MVNEPLKEGGSWNRTKRAKNNRVETYLSFAERALTRPPPFGGQAQKTK